MLIVFVLMFTTGIGLFLAACNVFARDIQYMWGILAMTWLFLSPVFWQVSFVRNIKPGPPGSRDRPEVASPFVQQTHVGSEPVLRTEGGTL